MIREEFELKVLLFIMTKSLEEISKVDEEMQEILEDFNAKIQWKLGDLRAYLLFEEGKVTGKLDEEIENLKKDRDVEPTVVNSYGLREDIKIDGF